MPSLFALIIRQNLKSYQEEISMKMRQTSIAALAILAATSAVTTAQAEGKMKLPEVSYSGYIRVDGTYKNEESANGTSTSTSDIKSSKVQLTFDAEMSEQVLGSVTFEWAGSDEDRVEVDEAIIVIKPKDTGFEFSLGKQVLPFGAYNSSFMTDPQSLELGETKEHSAHVAYTTGIATITGAIYNGDVDETGDDDDHIDGLAARLDLNFNDNLSAGASLISNIAESDTLESSDGVDADTNTIQDSVAGFSANVSYTFNKLQFDAEYVTALDEFQAGELAFDDGSSYQPQVFTFETAFDLGGDSFVAGRIEAGEDGGDVIPENTFGIIYQTPLLDYLTFAAEYQREEYETNDEVDAIKLRLKLKF